MKIYKLTCASADMGNRVTWHSSRRDAESAVADHRREYGDEHDGSEITPIVFRPTRQGILQMLRVHAPDWDNG